VEEKRASLHKIENRDTFIDSQVEFAVPFSVKHPLIYRVTKRKIDLIASLVGLTLLSPVMLAIAIAVKRDGGTVVFTQQRVGKDGKLFNMYKFRSMVMNAEAELDQLKDQNDIEGHMFKMKDDPRITKVGKIIRRTSLDELPQLWNVVKGDMSLIGPRPPLPNEVEDYDTHHLKRLTVTPGCSGIWQVSGRNNIHFEDMVHLDLHYIENTCFWMDMRLIAKTIGVMVIPLLSRLRRKAPDDNGAY
jgi:lipopolysaccharide/colanic/teichoic acid biosynthesis glycosyltransferase